MLRFMIQLRVSPYVLKELARIWPNESTGKPGISANAISKETGVNRQTILNYMESPENDFNPSWSKLKQIEGFFGGLVMFCMDSGNTIDNEKRLKKLEGFLQTYIYEKPSKRSN